MPLPAKRLRRSAAKGSELGGLCGPVERCGAAGAAADHVAEGVKIASGCLPLVPHACLVQAEAAAQGRGIGAAQLRWMAAEAAARGASSLMLEVRASNAAARRLYARHGFQELHVRRRYYPGGEDAVIMRKVL